jgi:hypothetical protein
LAIGSRQRNEIADSAFFPRGFSLRDDLSKLGIYLIGGKPAFFISLSFDTFQHFGKGCASRFLVRKKAKCCAHHLTHIAVATGGDAALRKALKLGRQAYIWHLLVPALCMSYFDITGLNFKSGDSPMLTPHIPTNPYWLALPRGARVEIRPVMTAVAAAAQAASARRLSAPRAAVSTPVEI